MADDTATADPAQASQDEVRRRIMEELARRQQQPQQQQVSGFALSAEARERQKRKREQEEAARQQQQQRQRELDDIFLKTLAKIYGLPPRAESFKQEFVPVLMACTVLQSNPEMMVGKFAGARELPPVQIAKDHVIAQGGSMTPELAMHMAMLAASNPDMAREGVEIQGATEEDKLMLYAAAQLLGLKVLNPPKIDNEQKQAQRIEACKLGWQNLNQWAQPGQAPAPMPQTGPTPGPDDDEDDPAQPTQRPRNDVPPVIPVPVPTPAASGDTGKKPPPGNAADAGNASAYSKLSDDDKAALRALFRVLSQGNSLTDEQIDKQLAPVWEKQNDEQRKAVLAQAHQVAQLQKDQAEAEAAPEPLTPPPAPSAPPAPELKPVGQRTYKELLPAEKKLLQEDELTKQNKPGGGSGGEAETPPKTKLSKQEQKDLADRWDGMSEEDRTKLYDEAGKLEAELAEKAEKARQAKLRKLAKESDAAFEKQKQEHAAQVALFDAALAASDPAAPREAPALKPVEGRKFAELLPAEQNLLLEDEMTRLKKNALTDAEKKTLTDKWDGMDEAARKAHFAEAGAKELTLADAVEEERKTAVKALADAAARAEAAKPKPVPPRTWEELDEADREEIREFVRREKSLKKAGDEYTEDEIKAPWGRIPDGAAQNEILESIKQANVEARAAATAPQAPVVPKDDSADDKTPDTQKWLHQRSFDELPVPAQEILNKHFLERKAKEGENITAHSAKEEWDALGADETAKMALMKDSFSSHPEMADAVKDAMQAERDAKKSPAPVPAAGSPVVAQKTDEKPRRSFGQIVRDLLSSVWSFISYPFRRTPKPAAEATQPEPVVEEDRTDALPAAGDTGEPKVQPTPQPSVVVENKTENKDPVPTPTPAPTPAPVEQSMIPVAAEKTTPPNLLKDVAERNWNELLDPEKEAAQIGLDNTDAGSEWDKLNAADRNVAINLGIDAQPLLAVKIDQARDEDNARLVAATTPPPSNAARVKQQADIIATTPPPSNVARVQQKENLAAVTPTPAAVADKDAEQEVPKDDAAFESALKTKGLTRDALLAMPPDQRKGVLAEIKKEQAQEKAPVVEVRRDDPPAPPPEPPATVSVEFNRFSVDKIRELPPSADAHRVIQNQSLPKSIDKDKLLQAYQQIRAEVVRQQVACPGFRVSQAFLGEAARKNHTEELLGHKGLRPEEAHAILDALRAEGLTTGKKDTHRNVSYGANDWQTKLASHYKPEMG